MSNRGTGRPDEFCCPECKYPQYCPCDNCVDRLPKNKKPWEWVDGELIKCGNCGITKHCDWWLDRSGEFYERVPVSKPTASGKGKRKDDL